MPNKDRVEMLLLLVQNLDVFAWSPYEVPVVDSEFITYDLMWTRHIRTRSKSQGGWQKSMSRL